MVMNAPAGDDFRPVDLAADATVRGAASVVVCGVWVLVPLAVAWPLALRRLLRCRHSHDGQSSRATPRCTVVTADGRSTRADGRNMSFSAMR